jgi:magnesium transporter
MVRRFEISNNALIESESVNSPVLVYINPDASEKNKIMAESQIDEHTLASALDPDEVSRIEFDSDRLLLIWKRPMNYSGGDKFYFNVASVGLFLAKNRFVVVLTEDIPVSDPTVRQLTRFDNTMDVMLNFLSNTIHHYLEHLKVIKMISRDIQKKINTSLENKHLIQMINLSESLVYYTNAISGNDTVLVRLRNFAEKQGFPAQTIALLDDLIIENTQCYKQADVYATVFAGLMDARGTLINNNMSILLKKLTIINIVFLPLNLIASIGGMSEFTMMTEGIHWQLSYLFFFVGIMLMGWLTYILLGRIDPGVKHPVWSRKKKIKGFRV